MKVWIVTTAPRDGDEIYGVFGSEEDAKKYIATKVGTPYGVPYRIANGTMYQQTYKSHWFDITEWDVQ